MGEGGTGKSLGSLCFGGVRVSGIDTVGAQTLFFEGDIDRGIETLGAQALFFAGDRETTRAVLRDLDRGGEGRFLLIFVVEALTGGDGRFFLVLVEAFGGDGRFLVL